MLLSSIHIQSKEGRGPLDIIDLKALDEKSLKPVPLLTEEIIAKVDQHLLARKTQGILFTFSGSKLDLRKISEHQVSIDSKGYLCFDEKRVFMSSEQGGVPIKAERLRSYTILRIFADKESHKIRIFDDHDLIRLNRKLCFVDSAVVHSLALDRIALAYREDAKNYDKGYFELRRGELTEELKSKLLEKMLEFSPP